MENAINISVTPLQALLGLLFQIWIIVFPIILIRKLNYLTALITSQNDYEEQTDDSCLRSNKAGSASSAIFHPELVSASRVAAWTDS